jgi:hypothetical protein
VENKLPHHVAAPTALLSRMPSCQARDIMLQTITKKIVTVARYCELRYAFQHEFDLTL